jgi:hypothetical protein
MLVNIRMNKKKLPIIALGINILVDLDKNKKTINPAIKVIMAVLVPD